LPQNSFLPKNLSVKKILNLYFDRETVAVILEDEFLETMYLSKISELSGGELRYLELKLLLKSTAKFVLLDEPLNALSPLLREKIIRLIANEKASKGIIITDHEISNLSSITTENYLMNNATLKKITGIEDLVLWNYLPTSYTTYERCAGLVFIIILFSDNNQIYQLQLNVQDLALLHSCYLPAANTQTD